jgi:hypothetical protein
MQGRIVKFHESLNVGVIKTEDGRRYRFERDQVINPNGRFVGYEVDFVEPRRGQPPKEIILLTGSIWSIFGSEKNGGAEADTRRAS